MKSCKLYELLQIKKGDFITFAGGGGKTSVIYYISRQLAEENQKHVITTSTKMHFPHDFKGEAFITSSVEEAASLISKSVSNSVFVAREKTENNKVSGYSNAEISILMGKIKKMIFLNEGDGSKGKPLKCYREYEPVIPGVSNKLVYILGGSALGKPFTEETVHRSQLSTSYGRIITPEIIGEHIRQIAEEKFPGADYEKICLINQSDSCEDVQAVAAMVRPYFNRVISGSVNMGFFETEEKNEKS
jgi:probable selenium-dependent hydroxylase accessory protein YqeC